MLNLQKLLEEHGDELLQNFYRQLQDKIAEHTWQETRDYFLEQGHNR